MQLLTGPILLVLPAALGPDPWLLHGSTGGGRNARSSMAANKCRPLMLFTKAHWSPWSPLRFSTKLQRILHCDLQG